MESTYTEICSGYYRRYNRSVWGHMFRLVTLTINCVVLIKFPSVICLFVLVDMR